ncbi:MAG: SH3 domain-containing protein [Anaerolineae bacterium]|nr:SH3 domain-containing protein [Anaerolineae bacterium]
MAVSLVWVWVVALLAAPGLAAAQSSPTNSWVGEYFNNPTLSGSPVLVRTDPAIDFTWTGGAPDPGLPVDRFSVRWTSTQFFDGGHYRFTARSDDGVRVYVDNRLIIDAWYDHTPDPAQQVEVDITAGQHALRVEYYENSGFAVIVFDWQLLTPVISTAPWVAEYFNNVALSGPPALTRNEEAVNYSWDYGSPVPGVIVADNFSARWTGSPHFSAGRYTFTINADDGVRVWLDNQLLIDAWFDSAFTPPYLAVATLSEGLHAMRVEYYERAEVAGIRVQWARAEAVLPTPTPQPPPPPTSPDPTTIGAWQADFFNNTALSGAPVYSTAVDGLGLDLDWRTGSPNAVLAADNFSARLTRRLIFASTDVRFVVRADDGIRFLIDGVPVLSEWHTSSGDYYFLDRQITVGEHTLTVEYYEAGGLASLLVYWLYPKAALAANTGVNATVNAFLLNVRTGPGVNYPILGRANRNQTLVVTGRSTSDPRWVRVNLGTAQGWLNGTYTTLYGPLETLPVLSGTDEVAPRGFGTPTGLRIRTTGNLNVRTGPGISYPLVGWLVSNSVVDVVGRNAASTWWEVNFAYGRGWISGVYAQFEGNQYATVPVTG